MELPELKDLEPSDPDLFPSRRRNFIIVSQGVSSPNKWSHNKTLGPKVVYVCGCRAENWDEFTICKLLIIPRRRQQVLRRSIFRSEAETTLDTMLILS
ncbi:hypothetical protein TNIN_78451 [Trichonephila inaurata madagascariensis]|uniref:Uncharacterized protein n=1 Tax=Trichonephila inaurata madagascariensis TaxID=2747483 RepID=A0A8X6JV23_9ARAC|nr:hypothetical protein TNIN_78451 [Trichonephila inaurata madagascariensis]